MAIVMGLDQHRAQITAEWIDTDTGEIGRARVSPALRADVRRFVKRFEGRRPLEVALEATTGWRFVAEESAPPVPRCISPSRPRRRPDEATRSAPRPTGPTRGICASC